MIFPLLETQYFIYVTRQDAPSRLMKEQTVNNNSVRSSRGDQFSCIPSKMKARTLFPFFFLIVAVITFEKIEAHEVLCRQQGLQDNVTDLLAKLEKRIDDLQRDIASLKQKDESIEKRIQNEVAFLKEKNQSLEKQLQSLEEQHKLHQTDILSTANKAKLVEDIVPSHNGLINSSLIAQHKDVPDRLNNLESESLVGKKDRAILHDTIQNMTGRLRLIEAETKLQNTRLSSLNAECSNFSMALEYLRAQHKDFSHDVIVVPSEKRTALHVAVLEEELEQVRELLRNGSNIEAQDFKKWRPLHLATRYDDSEVMEELLTSGAEINPVDIYGCTPLHWAVIYSRDYHVELLLKNGANIEAKDFTGETALVKASYAQNRTEVFELLVQWGANINSCSNGRYTALHSAARLDNLHFVKILVENGADVRAKDWRGKTAADIADIYKQHNVADYLKLHT